MSAGESLQIISLLVMLAASASFTSPFSYQTNLVAYDSVGYVFKDFLHFGFPMQVVRLVVSVGVIVLGGGLRRVSWGISGILFALVCVGTTAGMSTPRAMSAAIKGVLASLSRACGRRWRSSGETGPGRCGGGRSRC